MSNPNNPQGGQPQVELTEGEVECLNYLRTMVAGAPAPLPQQLSLGFPQVPPQGSPQNSFQPPSIGGQSPLRYYNGPANQGLQQGSPQGSICGQQSPLAFQGSLQQSYAQPACVQPNVQLLQGPTQQSYMDGSSNICGPPIFDGSSQQESIGEVMGGLFGKESFLPDESVGSSLRQSGLPPFNGSMQQSNLQGGSQNQSNLQGGSQNQSNLQGVSQNQSNLQGRSQNQSNLQGEGFQNQSNVLGGSQYLSNLQGGTQNQSNLQEGSQNQSNLQGRSQNQSNLQGGSQNQSNLQGGSQNQSNPQGVSQQDSSLGEVLGVYNGSGVHESFMQGTSAQETSGSGSHVQGQSKEGEMSAQGAPGLNSNVLGESQLANSNGPSGVLNGSRPQVPIIPGTSAQGVPSNQNPPPSNRLSLNMERFEVFAQLLAGRNERVSDSEPSQRWVPASSTPLSGSFVQPPPPPPNNNINNMNNNMNNMNNNANVNNNNNMNNNAYANVNNNMNNNANANVNNNMNNASANNIRANQSFVTHLTPKRDTGCLHFLQQYPNADGRGIIIAILDTGVDPGAAGLMQTSDGKIKVIERYDCSGVGDVDTSTIVQAAPGDGGQLVLKGLTGRSVVIPPTWNNPSGNYHIGFKPVYELYPPDLKERMKKDRRQKHWDDVQNVSMGIAEENLANAQLGCRTDASMDEKFAQEEAAAESEVLNKLNRELEDLGPVLDCILFQNDQNVWQICLSLGTGDGILLREYNYSHEYSPILPLDRFNVSVNVWDDGNLLEIVGMNDPHGTHVAAIAAGNFPGFPQLNGVAPGAQIVSMTIGDNRLNGQQETAKALSRAMTRLMRDPFIHIVNTSYGEQSAWAPNGQIAKMIMTVVDTYGVTWVSAAGNAGPCVSTIDSPAWICDDCIIGVAAYVSPDMMTTMYSHRMARPGMSFTWTSRGPTPDGRLGVSVCAPGGAITSVPNYTLMAATLMNGTSMATPHAAGCIALLLSRALQTCVKWTPYSVKRALENTAADVQTFEPFAQGSGLIQVPQAFGLIHHLSTEVDKFVRFNIECSGGPPGLKMRGIYLRNNLPDHPKEFTVSVTPVFFRTNTILQEHKIGFQEHLNLITYANYVRVPKFLEIHSQTTSFKVMINTASLAPGIYHTAIDAMDGGDTVKGRMFTVDVTIIVPTPLTFDPLGLNPMVDLGRQIYRQGTVKRTFIRPPKHATWAVLTMQAVTDSSRPAQVMENTCQQIRSHPHESTFVVHVLTLRQGHIEDFDIYKKVVLHLHEEDTFSFCVMGGKTVEVVISRWWEESEIVSVEATIKFFGVTIDKPLIAAAAMDTTACVELSSHLKAEEVKPSARLTHLVQHLQATDMSIKTLTGPRDAVSPEKPIFELRVSFEFSVTRETEVVIECPLLCEHLYESEYLSQLWMLFSQSKQYLNGGAAFPKRFQTKIQEGKYTVRMHIRHKDLRALHRFMAVAGSGNSRSRAYCKDAECIPRLPVLLRMTLPSPIPIKVFPNYAAAIGHFDDRASCDESSLFPLTIRPNEFINCYLRVLLSDDDLTNLPSTSGYCLEGKFNFSDSRIGKQFCESDVKIYIPQTPSDPTGAAAVAPVGAPNNPSTDELYAMCTCPARIKNIEELDAAISTLIGLNHFGLASKLLLHKFEKHPCTWTEAWNSKLRDLYDKLGWTHCIFYLDTNWLVSNPPDYRLF